MLCINSISYPSSESHITNANNHILQNLFVHEKRKETSPVDADVKSDKDDEKFL